jgi:hypothetical protein
MLVVMLVILLANLPLPLIFYLNLRVTWRFLKVRRLSRHIAVAKPRRFILGWWLNNLALLFVLTPMIYEHRIFVQNPWWLISFGIAAALSISGLLLMNSALGEELNQLARH